MMEDKCECTHNLMKPVPKVIQGQRIFCFEYGEYWTPPIEQPPELQRTVADYPLPYVTHEGI